MKRRRVYWVTGRVIIGAVLFGLGRLYGSELTIQRIPAYSLSPGLTGMVSGGTGYVYTDMASTEVATEEIIAAVQRYLDKQDEPDLVLARMRKFQWAYLVEVIERSSGRYAFSMMVSKATAQISPEAGPNLFWNTKYGSAIAEIGGGYGMLGRMLPEGNVGEMPLSEAEARSIAQGAVKTLDDGLELNDEISVFYGFYEFYVVQEEDVVGELDVNGYSGQVWYKDWGTPQISVLDLLSN